MRPPLCIRSKRRIPTWPRRCAPCAPPSWNRTHHSHPKGILKKFKSRTGNTFLLLKLRHQILGRAYDQSRLVDFAIAGRLSLVKNKVLRCLRLKHHTGNENRIQAMEAGTPYEQLQEAGIQTARLDEIIRQKDPSLKEVVEHLSRGEVKEAIEKLDTQGRVHEIADPIERLKAISHEYAKQPEGTLVVSPDNQSRMEINRMIHTEMQKTGQVDPRERNVRVLVARQEITGADRQWAKQYEPGNIVRYTKGSKTHGIEAGEYSRVESVNARENLLTVRRESGEKISYDPRRLQGVTLYRETERAFSKGDRVQFTAPNREQHIANRELGTIERIEKNGNLQLRMDSGRRVTFNLKENPHLDYGYAVNSHSSQGQTADRVLVHLNTEQVGEKLINRRLAYVAVSRGRHDAQMYTNGKTHLAEALSRDSSHRMALEPSGESISSAQKIAPSSARSQVHEHTKAEGHSISR